MINNLMSLLTYENIYLIANWGVIPFWLLLIFFPNYQITNFLSQSVIAPLLLATGYIYLSYTIYNEGNIFDGFELYSGLDGLYSMFANEVLLLIFWLHFLAISLFVVLSFFSILILLTLNKLFSEKRVSVLKKTIKIKNISL